ncbi:hypothetical protein WME97_37215 [Sorangium sp. So ce367]|uniref:hypothetical protein n=1 Tax=Sorangium sp. So ce367 TaxID=3133305 RepID=UPI003F5EBF78
MLGVLEAFKACGWAAWLALLAGTAGIGIGLAGAGMLATKARGMAWIPGAVAVLLGLSAVSVGLLGRSMGLARVEEALGYPGVEIDATQREMIRRVGTEEANQCVNIGASLGALPLVIGAAAVGIGLALRNKPA